MAWAALAQAAGFGKAVLITYYFGVSPLLDGYYLAQTIPAMLAGILAGFFQTGFTPLYSAHLACGEHEDAAALLGSSLALAAGIGIVVSSLVSALAPAFVYVLAGSAPATISTPAVTALRALAFLLLLNSLVDCIGFALNAHHRFAAAAAAPILNALVSSAILAAAPDMGLMNLIVGTLIGVICQLIIIVGAAHRAGIRVSWGRHSELPRVLRTGSAILPALGFSNLSVLAPSLFAARIGEGAVAVLSIASRLHGALTQVLAIALSTVLLPHFARALAQNDSGKVASDLQSGLPTVNALSVVIVIWVAVAGPGLVALLFQRGAFDSEATTAVASAWLWLTLGLGPSVWGTALAKALQAMQLGGLMSRIAALTFGVLASCAAAGVAFGKLNLVAYSPGLATAITAVVMAAAVNRRLSLRGSTLLSGGMFSFLALTLVSLGLAFTSIHVSSPGASILLTAAGVGIAIPIFWTYLTRTGAKAE